MDLRVLDENQFQPLPPEATPSCVWRQSSAVDSQSEVDVTEEAEQPSDVRVPVRSPPNRPTTDTVSHPKVDERNGVWELSTTVDGQSQRSPALWWSTVLNGQICLKSLKKQTRSLSNSKSSLKTLHFSLDLNSWSFLLKQIFYRHKLSLICNHPITGRWSFYIC